MADDGWVRIPPPTYRQRLVIGGFWTLAVAYVGGNMFVALGRYLEDALGGGVLPLIATVAVGIAIAQSLVILLVTRASPALDIHATRGVIRLRGRVRPFTDLVGALVEQPPIPRSPATTSRASARPATLSRSASTSRAAADSASCSRSAPPRPSRPSAPRR